MKIRSFGNRCRHLAERLRFFIATELAIPFQRKGRASRPSTSASKGVAGGVSLYSVIGGRKYLNTAERRRFVNAARAAPSRVRLLCLMLAWGGGRISETLALTSAAIDLESGVTSFETLKRRKKGIVRQVPLPRSLLCELDREFRIHERQCDPTAATRRLWSWSRTTAWRHVKAVMVSAGIHGMSAMPKGLRHTFGVASFQAFVPPHLVQRWLGHASLRTTAIYADVAGKEERAFAVRMWRGW
jgi:integrase